MNITEGEENFLTRVIRTNPDIFYKMYDGYAEGESGE